MSRITSPKMLMSYPWHQYIYFPKWKENCVDVIKLKPIKIKWSLRNFKYSWFTMFQVHSKEIQLYIHVLTYASTLPKFLNVKMNAWTFSS